jgi:hypothetical protein
MRHATRIGFSVFFGVFLLIGSARAQESKEPGETKVTVRDLPKAVQQTVQELRKGGELLNLTREVEGGKTFFEAEMRVGGHGKDILVDAKGKVVEVEEEMDPASLPASTQAAVRKSLGKGKVVKFESITKGGVLAGYEAVVDTSGKRTEVKLSPDGKLLAKAKE